MTLAPTNAALDSLVAQALRSRPELSQNQALTTAAQNLRNGAVYGPLIPSFGTSIGGMAVLGALAVILSGAAVWLFVHRDAGDVVVVPGVRIRAAAPSRALPAGAWSLRSVYARSLGMIAWPTFWWTLGMAAFAGWMIVLVSSLPMPATAAAYKRYLEKFDQQETQIEDYQKQIKALQGTEHKQRKEFEDFLANFSAD